MCVCFDTKNLQENVECTIPDPDALHQNGLGFPLLIDFSHCLIKKTDERSCKIIEI
jgi:hypothetical protein